MIEWFLLDRIDAEPARASIRKEFDLAAFDTAYEAQTTLAFVHLASTRAHVALHAAIVG